ALRNVRILAREKQVEAPLHAGGIHAPSRLNRDELLAVNFERYRHTGHARAHGDLPQDLSTLGVECAKQTVVGAACKQQSAAGREHRSPRSEEHTSELQSRVDLVCRLLL